MDNKQVIEQLKDLKKDRESFLTEGADEVYKKDIEAIDIAICVLERTAPEVPVQEQLSEVITKVNNTTVTQSCNAITIKL
ncbi:hypothetical protein [Clostridium butyricum]|uniref:hypothetical protein n=1 Tax=Clostridium butyricum TaxID=1492 RepID=UPI00071E9E9C|nr:hypothetical protein [Clostridium butyricum]ALS17782.1 hypothetical protein ATD26_13130 [Clostridium butyricum]